MNFNRSTSCYIRYVVIHQFDYYIDSFGYLFQVNWPKLKTLLKLFVDTLIKLQHNSNYSELIRSYDKPFDIDNFIETYLSDYHKLYPYANY